MMAELILTDAEKAADLWSDLDDEALGKLCRHMMLKQQEYGMGINGKDPAHQEFWSLACVNACKVLIRTAHDSNATTFRQSFKGLSIGDDKLGDWTVLVQEGYVEASDDPQVVLAATFSDGQEGE